MGRHHKRSQFDKNSYSARVNFEFDEKFFDRLEVDADFLAALFSEQ